MMALHTNSSQMRLPGSITILVLALLLQRGALCMAAEGETVLRQQNQGALSHWVPIVAELYLLGGGAQIQREEDRTPAIVDHLIEPPLHFTLNPPPADQPATILTDWSVFQARSSRGEPVSALLTARERGKPRLFLHRVFDEEKLAGYREKALYYIRWRLDVPQERLPIPGNPSGEQRRQTVLQNVKIVSSSLTVSRLDGVSLRGQGGTPVNEPPELQVSDLAPNIAVVPIKTITYEPRFATYRKDDGSQLNGVLHVALSAELEVGPALGVDPPERQTVRAEIRVAIGKVYWEIDRISIESERKRENPSR